MPSQNFTHIINDSDIDNLVMINGNVLIEVFDNRSFRNGVYVPVKDDSAFVPQFGKIVAVASDVCNMSKGDSVCFEKYKGERCLSKDSKRTFLIMKSSMVLAVVDDIDVSKL